MSAVTIDNGVFCADITPETGANVISLHHIPSGTRLLREPSNMQELAEFPEQYGLPVLFPPLRIDNGRFVFEGKSCQLPLNDADNNNHIHGVAVGRPWSVTAKSAASVELEFVFDSGSPEYEGFPFVFTLERSVSLTATGLLDRMRVINNGDCNMPLGLGYHSIFPAIPVQVRFSAGECQFEIGERYLPTGQSIPWDTIDPRQWFNPDGVNVGFHTRSEKLLLEDGTLLHGAELRYETGVLRYITDEKFGYWYTWNKRGEGDFISLEPMSWQANALNLDLPYGETGVRVLPPGADIMFSNELVFIPFDKK